MEGLRVTNRGSVVWEVGDLEKDTAGMITQWTGQIRHLRRGIDLAPPCS